ncbi:MAG TPA: hypothetical protein VJR95_14070 [Rhodanobacter sp.]|nr:hypothetical protein [Rhodanobacter sp.]
MGHRALPALFFSLFCTGVCAQSAIAPVVQHPRLPGDTQSRVTDKVQFHFKDGDSPGTRWARQMGQGVARIVAQRHGMTNSTLVQYGRPGVECKVSAMKPECP